MSIQVILQGSAFEPEAINQIAHVYYDVVSALGLKDFASQERAAKIIFQIASARHDLESDQFRNDTIAAFGKLT